MVVHRGEVRHDEQAVQWVARVEQLGDLSSHGPVPQRFVASAPDWERVWQVSDQPNQLAQLVRDRPEAKPPPTLEKMWAEAVFERVRERVLPEAPSRLECLFAVEVGYDAFDILGDLGGPLQFDSSGFAVQGPMIVPATTRGRWVAVDMRLFAAPARLPDTEDEAAALLADMTAIAERYWRGEAAANPLNELLCEGLAVPRWGADAEQAEASG